MESDNLQSDHVQKKELASGDLVDGYGFDNVILSIFPLLQDLKPAISYLPPQELELVHNALKLAFEAHDGQKRRSGEPFIIHPVEVARILGELELDWESIAAGLLHDTVEDTNVVTFDSLEREFGATVRHIVEGETKVSKLGKLKRKNENDSVQDVKADDLRQMFLAMTQEVRVIIVKLADRLHNMRTLSHMPPHKQVSIATETLQVFAPLAKLLGMYQIKSELENLSFMYTNAQDYAMVKRRVADLYKEHEKELVEVQPNLGLDRFYPLKLQSYPACTLKPLMLSQTANKILMEKIEDDQFLDLMTVKTDVRAVCKEPYSIYKAVHKSRGSINEVNQIAQLRIIIKPKPCTGVGPLCSAQQICYHVLGLVHGIWTPVPRAMKDYIATPKPNGYQSLHTTVIPFLYESMFRLEVQIRTEEMDVIAERGIAAHYSGRVFVGGLIGRATSGGSSRGRQAVLTMQTLLLGWLNAIREWQEEFVGNMTSREFVDTVTKDLLGSRVFVFTPRGEIKNLPKGATVIDYAYMIHTEIGNKMVAAKVNGNLVSPMHVLANAEVVEIITYNVKLRIDSIVRVSEVSPTTYSVQLLGDYAMEKISILLAELSNLTAHGKTITIELFVCLLCCICMDHLFTICIFQSFVAGSLFYQALSSKSAFQRHKQWLQHAKTRSARHKIMKFLREQAALSAAEITADTVNDFIANSEVESNLEEASRHSKGGKSVWERFLMNFVEMSSSMKSPKDVFHPQNGSTQVPKVNGKHNRQVQNVNLESEKPLTQGNGVAKMKHLNIPTCKEVLPGLESWKTNKVASWHSHEGHSIQWLCVVCIDRRGMMAEVTAALASVGITIISCVAEMDRGRGLAVMLFHVEGSLDGLVNACSSLDLVSGVLGWSTGCSWPNTVETPLWNKC
ncbi:putative GTP diphosphokinase RSH1, chloroplastic [Vitis vinifera]|uniref:Putative GTP diphosphokinase RSH1, chloroplastic n=1 Tax=Vitis vinifera TaxID=29760 RepID=A0A438FJ19_VITVI|nr:putative GTP diphosphokinase RSH1, chloroplastic [Vitis vinifera]